MSGIRGLLGGSLSILAGVILIGWAILIHVFACLVAYAQGGEPYFILTLIFPVFSEIFWLVKLTIVDQVFINPLSISIIIYPFLIGILVLGSFISEKSDQAKEGRKAQKRGH